MCLATLANSATAGIPSTSQLHFSTKKASCIKVDINNAEATCQIVTSKHSESVPGLTFSRQYM